MKKKKLRPAGEIIRALRGASGWITAEVAVHIGRRRIGRLLPLRVEPGRKFILNKRVQVRGLPYIVKGFGYGPGPIIHLEKIA